MDIVGICGSARRQSFNRMLLNLAGECMPAPMHMEILEWADVPPFNADVLDAQGFPPVVQAIRERIRQADGVVIATPEYNFSIPGMLKNLIDWISRGTDQPFADKPVAILSAATGPLGGARVQYDLRKVLLFMNTAVLVKPEIFVGQATQKFNAEGECTDALTRDFVASQMQAFQKWIERHQRLHTPS
ncbi:NAD(P)H-dependent oxidoreductase [Diaphorobacter sp.]|uniref:NADPH-dependent FMN reductase n=1 Tax=Diaphorobacter sp. TaxID=1934310 RepID=UPI0028A95D55|nr:NAD(P)H-dependent oxidoreductase [Diaphorobacter sp.]